MPKDWPIDPIAAAGLDTMAEKLGIQRRLELEAQVRELVQALQHKTYMIAVMVNMQGGRVVITREDVTAIQTGVLHESRDLETNSIILTMQTEVEVNGGNSNDISQA